MKKLVSSTLREFDESKYEEGEDGTLYDKPATKPAKKPAKRRKPKLSYDEKEARKRNKSFSGGGESDAWRGPNPNNH